MYIIFINLGIFMYRQLNSKDFFRITALYTAFSEKFSPDYFVSGETHNFWEIVIVTEGEIGVTAGNNVLHLSKGQAVLHEPNEFHNLWSERGRESAIIIFSFSAENIPASSNKTFEVRSLDEAFSVLEDILNSVQMHKHWAENINPECKLKAQEAIKRLEIFLLQTLSDQMNNKTGVRLSQSAKHYTEITKFLEKNIHRSLTVGDIAAECHIGAVTVKKVFSFYAGMGVISYFNRLKIRSAIKMLEEGATVCEVSESLGFLNQNYFCTVFKRITGKTPKSFRI